MSAEGNDFVATATAEKRLREVLAERFNGEPESHIASIARVLLKDAEITYLPRKRSVSILLRYPETAAPKPSNGKVNATPEDLSDNPRSIQHPDNGEYANEPPIANQNGDPMYGETIAPEVIDAPAVRDPKRGARFGEFQPTVTSAPEYHEDDYFTE